MPELILNDSVTSVANGTRAQGNIAQRLLQTGFNVNALRTNATLRKDEWKEYDTAVVEVARSRLVGVGNLLSRGLRYRLRNALGKTRLEWEKVSDMNGAEVTMSGISESQNDRVTYDLEGMPIPIIHKDFNINVRALEASRTTGEALDTTQAKVAARKVSETIETMLFAGATVLGANNPIYGYKTAPNRNTGSLPGANWATATGDQIVAGVLTMIGRLTDDNMYGPYVIYVPNNAFVHMGDDYKAASDKAIITRVKEIPGIADVIMSKDLVSGEVLMVQLTSDVVDMVDGMGPTTVEWESHAGFVVHFKVLAIMIPRIRNDSLLQSGIAHYVYP
jgi:uncharacterized linocin/CFP29 family protein